MARHVTPGSKPIFKLFLLAILRRNLWFYRVGSTSFPALGADGRIFAAPLLLLAGPANGGVVRSIYLPGRLWRWLLLSSSDRELAKMGYFSCLAMIAGPLSRTLALSLVQGTDAGPIWIGADLLLPALTFGA